jgi:hypothetical protein
METRAFYDEISLAETAESLAKKALKLGLISSFVVRHYPDSKQFFIPNEQSCEPLTPERAYLQLKRLVDAAA